MPLPLLKQVCLFNVMSFLLVGCSIASDPHENFRNILRSEIGTRIDLDPMLSMCSENQKYRVEKNQLQNGNIEYRHILRRGGVCTYYCEVDPYTRRVVNVRYEGSREDCAIVP